MSNKSKLSLAAELLKIKAVKLQPEQPFTWASGWKSPFYCDNRKTLSFPGLRTRVKLGLANLILEEFPEAGYELSEVTRDLHGNGPCGVMTDYEAKFYSEGITINRCVGTKIQWTAPVEEKIEETTGDAE